MALGHGDRRKRSRRKEQLRAMVVTRRGLCGAGLYPDIWDAGGDRDQLIPWDELCPGLLAPVLPLTSVPQPRARLPWPCHGDQGQTRLVPSSEFCPGKQGTELAAGRMPGWISYPGGKDRAVCATSPEPRGHIPGTATGPGDTKAQPQQHLGDWESAARPWPCPAGSATGNPKSSRAFPLPPFPQVSFVGFIFTADETFPGVPNHGHSLSCALGVGMGSRQLPGTQGSQWEGVRSWMGFPQSSAGSQGSCRESSVSPEPELGRFMANIRTPNMSSVYIYV